MQSLVQGNLLRYTPRDLGHILQCAQNIQSTRRNHIVLGSIACDSPIWAKPFERAGVHPTTVWPSLVLPTWSKLTQAGISGIPSSRARLGDRSHLFWCSPAPHSVFDLVLSGRTLGRICTSLRLGSMRSAYTLTTDGWTDSDGMDTRKHGRTTVWGIHREMHDEQDEAHVLDGDWTLLYAASLRAERKPTWVWPARLPLWAAQSYLARSRTEEDVRDLMLEVMLTTDASVGHDVLGRMFELAPDLRAVAAQYTAAVM